MQYSLHQASSIDVCFLTIVSQDSGDWCDEDTEVTTIEDLLATCEASKYIWSTRDEEGLATALWGVMPAPDPNVGRVWMLASKPLHEAADELQSLSKLVFTTMLMKFPMLEAFVEAGKEDAIDYLRRAGFTIERAQPSPTGHAMRRAWMASDFESGRTAIPFH